MRLPFGLELRRRNATPVNGRGTWWPLVREPYSGAWAKHDAWTHQTVVAHHAVYTCATLIASDIGKLRPKLVEMSGDGIWTEASSPAFSPVLRRPNRFQNHIQFKEIWVLSKLLHGNTYALKERDARGVVRALYLLEPTKVKPLVAPDGAVYYQLGEDHLAGAAHEQVVPASEIIHDRMNCLFHPLVGTSPIFASGAAANIGLKIEGNSASFFGSGSNPSGVLVVPGPIDQANADRIAERWSAITSGDKSGKVPVLPNGMTFQPMRMNAVDSQMIEHLKWSAETIASTFHIPAFKIGVGAMPTYQNAEVLNQIYYSDCLQSHIESLEVCLDEGLGLAEKVEGRQLGVELDLDALLRMDQATQVRTLGEGIKNALYSPNEARRKVDLKPLPGGDTVYMQQQNYSLAALDKRDRDNPFPAQEAAPPLAPPANDSTERALAVRRRAMTLGAA
jgi:HK97 family phage portal protein